MQNIFHLIYIISHTVYHRQAPYWHEPTVHQTSKSANIFTRITFLHEELSLRQRNFIYMRKLTEVNFTAMILRPTVYHELKWWQNNSSSESFCTNHANYVLHWNYLTYVYSIKCTTVHPFVHQFSIYSYIVKSTYKKTVSKNSPFITCYIPG